MCKSLCFDLLHLLNQFLFCMYFSDMCMNLMYHVYIIPRLFKFCVLELSNIRNAVFVLLNCLLYNFFMMCI